MQEIFDLQSLLKFAKLDRYRSFVFGVLMICLPVFILAANAINWDLNPLVFWLWLFPVFWIGTIFIRWFWFCKFYRTSSSFEDDYMVFRREK